MIANTNSQLNSHNWVTPNQSDFKTDAAENDAFFQDADATAHVSYQVIEAEDIASLLYTFDPAIIRSKDHKRSITIDPMKLSFAFECVMVLLVDNPHFENYADLREFTSKLQIHQTISRAMGKRSINDPEHMRYVACMKRTFCNEPALHGLLNAAPEGSEEQMALDLLFLTHENE